MRNSENNSRNTKISAAVKVRGNGPHEQRLHRASDFLPRSNAHPLAVADSTLRRPWQHVPQRRSVRPDPARGVAIQRPAHPSPARMRQRPTDQAANRRILNHPLAAKRHTHGMPFAPEAIVPPGTAATAGALLFPRPANMPRL